MSESHVKLVARSILTETDHDNRRKYLLPGGDILVLVAPLWSSGVQYRGPVEQTSIDIWSIRDPANPRRILRTRTRFGWDVDNVLLQETDTKDVARIVLACEMRVNNATMYALESYDVNVADAEPSYSRIVAESWQPIPRFPGWASVMETTIEVSHTTASGIVACTVQHLDRPEGDYEHDAGEFDNQLNPRFPLPGFEQIYLVDLSGPVGRWLHPRHVESFIGARAYIHDEHLYLLGRTASTCVVRDYHFSADMLLSTESSPDTDDYLDLGSPLAEYESCRLPDHRVPWGNCDSQTVRFDPVHGFTILLLRDYFAHGQLVRLPLPGRDIADGFVQQPSAHAFAAPHLPEGVAFKKRWLGRNSVIIWGEDDIGTTNDELFFMLSFTFREDSGPDADQTISDGEAAEPLIVREVLHMDDAGLPLYMDDLFVIDERSRRLCMMVENAPNEMQLFVHSLSFALQS